MQLVDEQDDLAFLLREVIEDALQAFLEFAAELGAGDQRAHVEREDALVLESLRHLAVHDALGEALDDRGLADARLADQHGIVLGAALQHLDRAADLVVAADHRVELVLLGARRQVNREFLQRTALLLRVRVVDLLAAAHVVDRLGEGAFDGAGVLQDLAECAAVLAGRQHEEFARDVLVAALLRQLVGDVQELAEIVRDLHVALRALDGREPPDLLEQARAQQVDVDAGPVESGRALPPSWSRSASSRCVGSTNCWSRPTASDCASASASWNFDVRRSDRIRVSPSCAAPSMGRPAADSTRNTVNLSAFCTAARSV